MAFCSPKACGSVSDEVDGYWLPFSFRQRHWLSLVGRQDGSPSDQPVNGGVHLRCFHGGLVEGEKALNC